MTEPARILVIDLAKDLGLRKQRIFKILMRLGIRTQCMRDPQRRNRVLATISHPESVRVKENVDNGHVQSGVTLTDSVHGHFYLVQLEPGLDPHRFKVGFTNNLSERLRKHRCAAPFSIYVKTWACLRTWERAAIDCVTRDCAQLSAEVFRGEALDVIINRCDQFFSIMPTPAKVV